MTYVCTVCLLEFCAIATFSIWNFPFVIFLEVFNHPSYRSHHHLYSPLPSSGLDVIFALCKLKSASNLFDAIQKWITTSKNGNRSNYILLYVYLRHIYLIQLGRWFYIKLRSNFFNDFSACIQQFIPKPEVNKNTYKR